MPLNPIQFQAQAPQIDHPQVIAGQPNYGFFTTVLPQMFQMAQAAKSMFEGNPLQDAQAGLVKTQESDYWLKYINETNDPAQRQNRRDQALAYAKEHGNTDMQAAIQTLDPSKMTLEQQARNKQFGDLSTMDQWSREGAPPNGQTTAAQPPQAGGGQRDTAPVQSDGPAGAPEASGGSGWAPVEGGPGGGLVTSSESTSDVGPPATTPMPAPGQPPPEQTGVLPDGQSAREPGSVAPQGDDAGKQLLHEVARRTNLDPDYLYLNQDGHPLIKPEIGAAMGAPVAALVPVPPPGPEDPYIQAAVKNIAPKAADWVRAMGRSNMWQKFINNQTLSDTDVFQMQVNVAQGEMLMEEAGIKAGFTPPMDFKTVFSLAGGLRPGGKRGPEFVQAIEALNQMSPSMRKMHMELGGQFAQMDLDWAKFSMNYTLKQGQVAAQGLSAQASMMNAVTNQQELPIKQQRANADTAKVNLQIDEATQTYSINIDGQTYTGTKADLKLQTDAAQATARTKEVKERSGRAATALLQALGSNAGANVRLTVEQGVAMRAMLQQYQTQAREAQTGLIAAQKEWNKRQEQLNLKQKSTESEADYRKRLEANAEYQAYLQEVQDYKGRYAGATASIGKAPTATDPTGSGIMAEMARIAPNLAEREKELGITQGALLQAIVDVTETGKVQQSTLRLLKGVKGGAGSNARPGPTSNATPTTPARGSGSRGPISPGTRQALKQMMQNDPQQAQQKIQQLRAAGYVVEGI